MRKFRLFVAIFVFTMVAGCTDFAPKPPSGKTTMMGCWALVIDP